MAASKVSKLVIVSKDKKDGDAFRMKKGSCTIGSDLDKCDIKIHREGVAPVHALINTDSTNRVWLKALASVEVNGVDTPIREPCELTHCDLITICGRSFRFEHALVLSQEPPRTPSKGDSPSRLQQRTAPAAAPQTISPSTSDLQSSSVIVHQSKQEPSSQELSSNLERALSRASVDPTSLSNTHAGAPENTTELQNTRKGPKTRIPPVETTEIEEPSEDQLKSKKDSSLSSGSSTRKDDDIPPPKVKSKSKVAPKRSAPKKVIERQSDESNIQIDLSSESEPVSAVQKAEVRLSGSRQAEIERLAGTSSRFAKLWEPSGDRRSRHAQARVDGDKLKTAAKPEKQANKKKRKLSASEDEEREDEPKSKKPKVAAKKPQKELKGPYKYLPLGKIEDTWSEHSTEDQPRPSQKEIYREIRRAAMSLEQSLKKKPKLSDPL